MDFTEVLANLERLQTDAFLWQERNIIGRHKALDFVRFAQELVRVKGKREDWTAVAHQAAYLQQKITQINQTLYHKIRTEIQSRQHTPASLRQLFNQFTQFQPGQMHIGEDGLDVLLNGILQIESLPVESVARTAEMVHLEFTPARVLLDMLDQLAIQPNNVFYDLGSGLGQVAILVNLLTSIICKGVEYDPLFCEMAQQSAHELGLTNVHFIHGDAQTAAYGDGTIFFMFTPFTGHMLQEVLAKLEVEARKRPITLCTYGTITTDIAKQPWLHSTDPNRLHDFKLAIFQTE